MPLDENSIHDLVVGNKKLLKIKDLLKILRVSETTMTRALRSFRNNPEAEERICPRPDFYIGKSPCWTEESMSNFFQ